MKLSIVTTLYYSAPYLEEFYQRMRRAAEQLTSEYDIIFVNDGSPDACLSIAQSFVATHTNVSIIDLSRNFGHHKAIMTGLAQTTGDVVFLIDCDLEEEPELLSTFYQKMQETGADIVYGSQKQRTGDWFERISGSAFYWLYNHLSEFKIPPNVILTRLMSRRYVDALVAHKDVEVFLAGLCVVTGFLQVGVPVTKYHKGTSAYSLPRKISAFTDAITSFSSRPLVFIFYLGSLVVCVAGGAAVWLIVRKLMFGILVSGWESLIVSIWMIGGLMIFCLGVIGVYLSKVFMETKRRPSTVIRAIYTHSQKKQADG